MKAKFLFLNIVFLLSFFHSCLIGQVNMLWAKGIGGTAYDGGEAIAVDNLGNVYTTGMFNGVIDFDPGSAVYNLSSVGVEDIFIYKLDRDGNFVWAKSMGGTGMDCGYSIAVDSFGNVYTGGSFGGTVDFDPGIGVYNLVGISVEAFVCKLDASGNFIWAKNLGGSAVEEVYGITVDLLGNVYTTGVFNGVADFDPSGTVYNLTSAGGGDIFISKLSTLGNFVWAKRIGGTLYDDLGYAIAVDSFQNVYTTGKFAQIVDFDPGVGVYNLTPHGTNDVDAFVCKLDVSGDFVWAKNFGGPSGADEGYAIAVDGSGNVYTTGSYQYGDGDFDPGAGIYTLSNLGVGDAYVSKLNGSGDFVWAKGLSGIYSESGISIALDHENNLFIVGYTTGAIDYDPGPGSFTLPGGGLYVVKLDSLGIFVWAAKAGSGGNGVDVDEEGNIYVTGDFALTKDFNLGSGVDNLTAVGSGDICVLKISGNKDVWPGDTENNHVVDNYDLLQVGLYYMQTGTSRTILGNVWQADSAANWETFHTNGADLKHVDCNGDGIIDNNDTLAINLNFTSAHAFAPPTNEYRLVNPDLHFTSISGIYPPGVWIDVDIMAGTTAMPVSNLYGIAFDIQYDASLVQLGTESLIYPISWFGNPGIDAIKIGKIDALANEAYGAETRINHINADGSGKIATFRFQAKSSISSLSTLNLTYSGYMANDSAGNTLLFNPQSYSVIIDPLATSIAELEDDALNIYPNPNNGNYNILFTSQEKSNYKLELRNVLGQVVYQETLPDFVGTYSKPISVSNFGKGVYTISLANEKHDVVKKIIVY